jgi:hypothetical protein
VIEPDQGGRHAPNVSAILAVQRGATGVAVVDAGCHAAVSIVLLGVPVASILHRAGHSRWWTVIAFIPLLNLIGLWVFAFSRWPVVDR